MPEPRKKYQALTNLSVPMPRMPGQPDDKRTFLVSPGEIVELTDAEAANLSRNPRVPVIRPFKESSEPLARITPVQLSGPIRRGVVNPPPDFAGVRADPPGASRIQTVTQPEMMEPAPGDETRVPAGGPIDITPGTAVTG